MKTRLVSLGQGAALQVCTLAATVRAEPVIMPCPGAHTVNTHTRLVTTGENLREIRGPTFVAYSGVGLTSEHVVSQKFDTLVGRWLTRAPTFLQGRQKLRVEGKSS